MSYIQIDYDKAIAQAKRLEQAAALCETSLTGLKREISGSETFWRGASGNAMRVRMAETRQELLNTKGQLTSIAAAIRQVAEELRQKDEELRQTMESFR